MKVVACRHLPSPWKSCDLINQSRMKLHSGCYLWPSDESLPEGMTSLHLLDHRWPHPKFLEGLQKLKVTLYVYGDFSLKLQHFKDLVSVLSSCDLTVSVASLAQKKLVSSLFPDVEGKIVIEPYEVPDICFDEIKRKNFRQTLGLDERDEIFGYAGRLNRQKGIFNLMKEFALNSLPQQKLVLIGPLDPHPFWQLNNDPDLLFVKDFSRLLTLSGGKIIHLKEVPHQQISVFYSAIDYFISLSTFHDEDFGLAAEEAVRCGRRTILTPWGGFHRFKDHPLVQFLPLQLGKSGYEVQEGALADYLRGKTSVDGMEERIPDLTREDRERIISEKFFLADENGRLNLELYRKLYKSYL